MSLPLPNLDDKRFDQLIEEARKLIPRFAPEWTDHNVHDPGLTLIELFAWLVEMQIYHLNQLPDRNYLKYLRLLGTKPVPASPAKVDLTLSSDSDEAVPVDRAEGLVAESEQGDTGFETDEAIDVLPAKIGEIVSYSNYRFACVTEYNNQPETFYYSFGENPQVGDVLYLGFDFKERDALDACKGRKIKLNVYLYEKDLPPKGKHGTEEPNIYPSAEIDWEYATGEGEWESLSLKMIRKIDKTWQEWKEEKKWISLGSKEPETGDKTLGLSQSNTISFRIPNDVEKIALSYSQTQEKLFWIRAKLEKADYEMAPRIDTILLNTVSATEGITVAKTLGEKSSGLPDQTFSIEDKPVLGGSQKVFVDGEEWEDVDDFDASGPDSNHYILDRVKGEVLFGNGINGRIPLKNTEIKITYRHGGGERGNVAANTEWRFSDIDGALKSIGEIRNWFPAAGGKEEESLDEAEVRARKELKVRYRAITSEDFETIARATPGIRVAKTGVKVLADENKVEVAVVPHGLSERPEPSEGFKRTVCEHLDKHRLITTEVEVVGPHYVRVSVSASVKIKPESSPEGVRERVEKALNTFLHPLEGGPEGEGWPFGRDVYKSEVYELIETKVEGVDGVVGLSTSKDGKIEELTLVYPGRHRIEIVSPQIVCKEESIGG